MSLPGLFEPTLFTTWLSMTTSSPFIRPMHPKTEVRPDIVTIKRILNRGWCAQTKIHGHRAQIHISANPNDSVVVFNRHGAEHKKKLEPKLEHQLRALFTPKEGWNTIDAEWLKPEQRIFVFDFLKFQDKVLSHLNFSERWEILPRIFSSDCIEVLPIINSASRCMEILSSTEDIIEGIVLKSLNTPGFQDTSIIRCRKAK